MQGDYVGLLQKFGKGFHGRNTQLARTLRSDVWIVGQHSHAQRPRHFGYAPADAPAEDVEQTEGSEWYKRTALVTNAMATIPYYEHVKHLLAAMKIMEDAGDIAWGMDDDTVVANLSAYAHKRANEKAELQ